jgi:hypothetical protein
MKLPFKLAILPPCAGLGGIEGLAFACGGDPVLAPLSVSVLPPEPTGVADTVFERLSPDVFFAGRAGTCGFGRSGMLGTLRNSVSELSFSPFEVSVETSGTFASAGGTA